MLLLALALAQAPTPDRAQYTVSVSASAPRRVGVEAKFVLRDATLRMEADRQPFRAGGRRLYTT